MDTQATPPMTPRAGSRSTPSSRPNSATIRGLPLSLQVPPLPPSIYRSLLVSTAPDGLIIVPTQGSRSKGVRIGWGAKGKVVKLEDDAGIATSEEEAVEVKGLAGIVRLWNGQSATDDNWGYVTC